jgi:hypothetical protein
MGSYRSAAVAAAGGGLRNDSTVRQAAGCIPWQWIQHCDLERVAVLSVVLLLAAM